MAAGLTEAGYKRPFTAVADAAAFADAMHSGFPASGVVLFKGSRGNKLEELVAALGAAAGFDDTGKGRRNAV